MTTLDPRALAAAKELIEANIVSGDIDDETTLVTVPGLIGDVAVLSQPQAGGPVAEQIADAVLSWMVKFDLLDAGNEYGPDDVLAVLNDLAPVASPQPANPAQVTELIEEAKDFAERMTGQPWACELVEKLIDALTAAIGAGDEQPFRLVEEAK